MLSRRTLEEDLDYIEVKLKANDASSYWRRRYAEVRAQLANRPIETEYTTNRSPITGY